MTTVAACFEALGQYAESVKLREETLALQKAKLGPDNSETLLNMAHLADNLIHLNRGTEAIPMIDECLTRGTGKDVDPSLIPSVLDLRLRYFAKARDAGACRKTADMWEEMKRLDAGALYNAACFRAIAASTFLATDKSHKGAQEAATEAGRAMEWLKQAVAAGYKVLANMRTDKDLDALRDRDDFKKLLADLEEDKPKEKK